MMDKFELADFGRIICAVGIIMNLGLSFGATRPSLQLVIFSIFLYFIGFWKFYEIMLEEK